MGSWLQQKRKIFIISAVIFCSFFITHDTFAASRYWVGSEGASINSASNWASADPASCTGGGAGIPTSADDVYFDADCDNSALIDVAFSVKSITIASGYDGTVTQNANVTVYYNFTDAGTISWAWTSGSLIFSGSWQTLSCSGTLPGTVVLTNVRWDFTLAAGCTISAGASPTWTNDGGGVNYTRYIINNGTINVTSGTFTATSYFGAFINNGTLNLATGLNVNNFNQGATATLNANNVTSFVSNYGLSNSGTINLPSATTFTVSGTLSNSGTITYGGTNILISGSWNATQGTFDTTGKVITFNGSWQTLSCSGTLPGTVVLTNVRWDFTLAAGCTISAGASPTWTNDGGGVNYTRYIINNGTINVTSGTFTATSYFGAFINNGTLNLATGLNVNNFNQGATATLNANNVTSFVSNSGLSNSGTINLPSATTFTAGGGLTNTGTITYGGTNISLGGSWNASVGTFDTTGKVIIFGAYNYNTLTCSGTLPGIVSVTNTYGFTLANGSSPCSITVNSTWSGNSGGSQNYTVTNNGIINVSGSSWAVNNYINYFNNNGTINFSGTTLTFSGTFTQGASATLNVPSLTTFSTGSLTNNGTINLPNATTFSMTGSLVNSGTIIYGGTTITIGKSWDATIGVFDTTGKTMVFNAGSSAVLTCSGTLPGIVSVTNTYGFTLANGSSPCSITVNSTWSGNSGGSQNYTVTNNGIINVSGSSWAVNNYINYFNNNGTINFSGTTFAVTGAFSNAGTVTLGSSTAMTFSSTFSNTGTMSGGSTIAVVGNFTQNGTYNMSAVTVTFNGSTNATFTTNTTFGGSMVISKSAANTLGLAQSVSAVNVTQSTGILSNPGSALTLTITGNLSVADASKFGGANLTVIMSNGSNQNLSVTSGTMTTPLTINKTANKVTLQTNYISTPACTVTAGAIYANGKTFTCANGLTFNSGGELQLQGAETITTPVLNSGSTVTYVGDGDSVADAYTVQSFSYYHLSINSTDTADSFTLPITTNILGNLNITRGTINGAVTSMQSPDATGGTLTSVGGYVIHTFTTTGTSNFIPNKNLTVDALVVGGGGGGGMDMGGGGGGGGVIYSTAMPITAQPYSVTVGAGGWGAPAGGGGYRGDGVGPQPSAHQFTISATNGGNSVFNSLTAVGGGYGGSSYYGYTPNYGLGSNGGSGGGASGYSNGGTIAGGTGTLGQGYKGGRGGGQYYSGGGGGAGAAGVDSSNQPNGGAGVSNSILGTEYYWGGGGGGASYSLGTGGNGGAGGGGGGAVGVTTGGSGLNPGSAGGGGSPGSQTNRPGGNAGANTGGGGGGGSHYNLTNQGGNGGSGIVIIRYIPSAPPAVTGGTVNLTGNLTQTGGTLSITNSNFVLNGASQTISLSATTTINSLTKIATASSTLTFGTTSPLVITATTTLQGTATSTLSLRSAVPGTYWQFDPQATTTGRVFDYIDVMDSWNIGTTSIAAPAHVVDSGHNLGWSLTQPIVTVSSQGNQIATTTLPTTNQDLGGAFTFIKPSGSGTISAIRLHQVGSYPGANITNLKLWSTTATTCAATKPVGATQFGTGSTTFTNGYATTTGTLSVGTSNVCVYVTYSINHDFATSSLGQNIDLEISDPSTDIIASGATVSPNTKVNISHTTMITNTATPDPAPNACTNNVISSVLSLRMADQSQNPTVYYLQNCGVWKMVAGGTPHRLTNPNLQVHDLTFQDLSGARGGNVKITLTISNMDEDVSPNFMTVTKTLSTSATVRAWDGN